MASPSIAAGSRLFSTAAAITKATITADTAVTALIRQKYRSLGRLIRKLPEENPYANTRTKTKQQQQKLTSDYGWKQLRSEFRKPLVAVGTTSTTPQTTAANDNSNDDDNDTTAAIVAILEKRLSKADEKISFLKMITPKSDLENATTITTTTTTTTKSSSVMGDGVGDAAAMDDDNANEDDSEMSMSNSSNINNSSNSNSRGGRWIYKNGQRYEVGKDEDGTPTLRDAKGNRVISNWDGKNLDPDSIKRHNHHLKRLGFRNNAHAKGIF